MNIMGEIGLGSFFYRIHCSLMAWSFEYNIDFTIYAHHAISLSTISIMFWTYRVKLIRLKSKNSCLLYSCRPKGFKTAGPQSQFRQGISNLGLSCGLFSIQIIDAET